MIIKVILLLALISFQLNAFTLSNSSGVKGWANNEVTIVVNASNCPSGVDVVGLIKGAMDVWNHVPTSSLKIKYGGTTTATTDGNPVVAYCETNFQAVTGADQDSVPGVARGNGNSQLATGLLVLNVSSGNANIANVSSIGLKVVVAHEIGHVLGLGHSQSADALMYYTYSLKTDLNLSQDDIDGVTYLYPSDEFDDNEFAGCGLIKNIPPPNTSIILLLILSCLIPVGVYLRLRSKAQLAEWV
jgi:hypothetical protein